MSIPLHPEIPSELEITTEPKGVPRIPYAVLVHDMRAHLEYDESLDAVPAKRFAEVLSQNNSALKKTVNSA